ncbi:hypothetical protein LTR10_000188 [Elasticomyces elasticus]|nr:hypothetical protein LTR10_000188 [Elasticomyces elasticus]
MGPPKPRHQDEYPFAIPFSYFRPMAGNRGTKPYIFEYHNLGRKQPDKAIDHNQGTSAEPFRDSNTQQSLPQIHAAREWSLRTDDISQAFQPIDEALQDSERASTTSNNNNTVADQPLAIRPSGSVAGPSRIFKGKATEVLDLAPEVYEEDWEASRQHKQRQAVRTTIAVSGGPDHAHIENAESGDQVPDSPQPDSLPHVTTTEVLHSSQQSPSIREATLLRTYARAAMASEYQDQSVSNPGHRDTREDDDEGSNRQPRDYDALSSLSQFQTSMALTPARRGSAASASTRTFGASSTYRSSPISQVVQDPHQLPLQSAMQRRLQRREEEIEMDSRNPQSRHDHQTTLSVGRANNNGPNADRKRKREDNDGTSQPRRKDRRGSQQMPDLLEVPNTAPAAQNDMANVPASALTHSLAAMCGVLGGAAGMVWYLAGEHAQSLVG